jgi:hypothetical protein
MLRCAIRNVHDESTAQDGPVDRPALKAAKKAFNFKLGDASKKKTRPLFVPSMTQAPPTTPVGDDEGPWAVFCPF